MRVPFGGQSAHPVTVHDPATRTMLMIFLWGGGALVVLVIAVMFLVGLFRDAGRL